MQNYNRTIRATFAFVLIKIKTPFRNIQNVNIRNYILFNKRCMYVCMCLYQNIFLFINNVHHCGYLRSFFHYIDLWHNRKRDSFVSDALPLRIHRWNIFVLAFQRLLYLNNPLSIRMDIKGVQIAAVLFRKPNNSSECWKIISEIERLYKILSATVYPPFN